MSTVFFNLRIDETLNDMLIEIAREEGRSKNKRIEYILKEYVKRYMQNSDAITPVQHKKKQTQRQYKMTRKAESLNSPL